jgi:hypothetical protein
MESSGGYEQNFIRAEWDNEARGWVLPTMIYLALPQKKKILNPSPRNSKQ